MKAHIALGRDAWKFDSTIRVADQQIASALEMTDNPSPFFLLQGSIRLGAGNFITALTSADHARTTSNGPKERGEADLLWARTCLASNIARIDQGVKIDRKELARARELLGSILAREPGWVLSS